MHSKKNSAKKRRLTRLGWIALLFGSAAVSSCGSPHYGMGVSVDYRNGGFQVRPEAHIGFSGRL